MNRGLQTQEKEHAAHAFTPKPDGLLQRKCACGGSAGMAGTCEECSNDRLSMQRQSLSNTRPNAVPPIVHEVLRSPGQPLDQNTRSFMEPRFGHDFSKVKVHTDAPAAESAKAINARAYTFGESIVFGAGQFAPDTSDGKRLLAHELTHVVQQPQIPNHSQARDMTSPGDSVEREADETAAAVTSSKTASVQTRSGGAPMLMGDWQLADPFPGGSAGHPPAGLTGCHVYLGGRRIDDFWAGTLANFRHLYLDTYEGPANFALIEAGPIGSVSTGTSGAWVKNSDWDARGVQWDITPSGKQCPTFISCLKNKTAQYHAAAHPYNYRYGPNSNSFAWWVLNECGLNISFLISGWPYLGVDYWATHAAPAAAPPPTVPATPSYGVTPVPATP